MPMATRMPKVNSKRLTAGVAVGIVLLLTTVMPAFAQGIRGTTSIDPEIRVEGSAAGCTRILQVSETVQARLAARRTELDARRDEVKARVAERRAEHQENANERRQNWDERWEKMILEMEAKAETSAQKAAITQFKIEMRSAFSARQTAIDAATAVFRSNLDKAVTDRKAAVQTTSDALKNAVKAAFDKAKADCTAGVAAPKVRANLKASLETAHAKFRADVQAADKIGTNARALAETRRVAVEKANEVFKAAAFKARETLKADLAASRPVGAATEIQP